MRKLRGDYSDTVKELLIEVSNRHIRAEKIKLSFFLEDLEDHDPPVSETIIMEVLTEYFEDPKKAVYGLAYIKSIIYGRVDRPETQSRQSQSMGDLI